MNKQRILGGLLACLAIAGVWFALGSDWWASGHERALSGVVTSASNDAADDAATATHGFDTAVGAAAADGEPLDSYDAEHDALAAALREHMMGGAAGSGAEDPGAAMVERAGGLDLTGPLHERFERESTTTRWESTESAIHRLVPALSTSEQFADLKETSVECRETLCRTELSYEGSPVELLREVSELAVADPLLSRTEGRSRIEDGRVVIFTAPPGVPLEFEEAAR